MSDKNTSAEACQHATVYKHEYRVTVTHTMGNTVLDETVQAGSQAHAALMVGMKLAGQIMMDPYADPEVTKHNVNDHLTVSVQLIV